MSMQNDEQEQKPDVSGNQKKGHSYSPNIVLAKIIRTLVSPPGTRAASENARGTPSMIPCSES